MRHYLCAKTKVAIFIDGNLEKPAWQGAPWTEEFVDIEGDARPNPWHRTRAKMLWDDSYLYIAAELEEPHIWGTLTEHDSVIFQDNDFEVFIDPDGDNHLYAELELNALNTTWDMLMVKPYRDGGPAVAGWEMHGLKTAVRVDGTLNDPSDTDRGWTVEIAIPWSAMKEISGSMSSPPQPGDQWRINFSRVQWETSIQDGKYVKTPKKPEENWVWQPQGVIDMHRPEEWGVVQFADGQAEAMPYPGLAERRALMRLYYAQRAYRDAHSGWAPDLAALGFDEPGVVMSATATGFEATLGEYHVDHQSRLWRGGYAVADRPTWGV
jgi:hypothetical protein